MVEDKYYSEIKDKLIDVEVTCRVKDYSKNKVMLENYYEIGRLIVEAQGGEKYAKYGDGLIKKYSKKLMIEIDKKYSDRTLRSIRKFYVMFRGNIWKPLVSKLNWSHFLILMSLKNSNEIMYYANRCIKELLSKRELQKIIKSKEYEKLSEETKNKLIMEYCSNPSIITREYVLN